MTILAALLFVFGLYGLIETTAPHPHHLRLAVLSVVCLVIGSVLLGGVVL